MLFLPCKKTKKSGFAVAIFTHQSNTLSGVKIKSDIVKDDVSDELFG